VKKTIYMITRSSAIDLDSTERDNTNDSRANIVTAIIVVITYTDQMISTVLCIT